MPLQATSGAASYDAFGGGVAAVPNYIEECFSTYLYTGTGSSLTITNNIDLSTKGGMVWLKRRSGIANNQLYDTTRGATKLLVSNTTGAETTVAQGLTAFGTTGFTLGTDTTANTSAETYASWTFREQSKFFDVVTYTGDGTTGRQIAHSLGSAPGCIIIKKTSAVGSWIVYHQSLGTTKYLSLESTSAASTFSAVNTVTSTYFVSDNQNASGATYVAYLFAHNAGGFGLTGTDNVISCGSYTGNGSATGPTVTLGYEPQLVLIKRTDAANDWFVLDNMRGLVIGSGGDNSLFPNSTSGEDTNATLVGTTATGFVLEATAASVNASGGTYIYIAIRRGPMKVPTSGTSVFNPTATSDGTGTVITTGFPVDLQIVKPSRSNAVEEIRVLDRLRKVTTTVTEVSTPYLVTSTSVGEATATISRSWNSTGYSIPSSFGGLDEIYWNFRRASGFFDQVCYTGTGVARTVNHNLGVAPELMLVKRSTGTANWLVYSANLGNATQLVLDSTSAASGSAAWNSTTPTASVFSLGTATTVNSSGSNYVAYLFATCPGVSKVGRYSGTGAAQTINCGFTSGARFVLIKRDNAASTNWYVWDSARGITSSDDPYLWINTTNAETNGTNYVDTDSTGFKLTASAPSQLNSASGGTYIFLAIA